ncbi:Prefoldin subunit 6 [Spironucleus salmonicida]|uniref:Prefoldin subunit 6 n=1 Tax=Spironucleus salmonicida TaxID=348837 RepID=V6LV51_9EUKA|nr:Prefoldin subunit 6 [Spironucleus salmonicida]|eukprot:EST48517.1 Prefoldin subunit 6 [Spironucleus salmonicida]
MSQFQKQFEDLQAQYVKLQEQKSKLIELKYENEMVLKDFETLNEKTNIFQMVGPAMVPKPLDEAQKNITEKVSFIVKQLASLEEQMSKLEKEIIDINKKRIAYAQQQAEQQEKK